MKKILFLLMAASTLAAVSCKKTDNNNSSAGNAPVTDSSVIVAFVNDVAVPQYQNLQNKANAFNNAIITLNSTPTDANLAAAQSAWRDARTAWEQCEGFLFGPVEDDNYDPNMDTWPVDRTQMDSLLASSNPLTLQDVQALPQSLRGFHPIEYIMWGVGGNNTAANITARQKTYMVSLAADVKNNIDSLMNSWLPGGGNFEQTILTAGAGNNRYTTRQQVILSVVGAMSDICDEVGASKIHDPFVARDSTLSESPFSHNSMADFINNITGAQNVYLCSYSTQGASLSSLIAEHNASLDNQIRNDFSKAIAALKSVNMTFEMAIYNEPTQLNNAMTALATLKSDLDGGVVTYVQTYVKD